MGRGCSDKGSKLLFEDHCETFQSKAKVHKLLLSKWRGDRESRWFWVLIALAADWDCSSFRCSWHWVKERDLLYYPFPLYFSFSKGIDGFGQEGLYKHFFRLSNVFKDRNFSLHIYFAQNINISNTKSWTRPLNIKRK